MASSASIFPFAWLLFRVQMKNDVRLLPGFHPYALAPFGDVAPIRRAHGVLTLGKLCEPEAALVVRVCDLQVPAVCGLQRYVYPGNRLASGVQHLATDRAPIPPGRAAALTLAATATNSNPTTSKLNRMTGPPRSLIPIVHHHAAGEPLRCPKHKHQQNQPAFEGSERADRSRSHPAYQPLPLRMLLQSRAHGTSR